MAAIMATLVSNNTLIMFCGLFDLMSFNSRLDYD